MTINLPDDLERSVLAQVNRGLFPSADELVAQAVRSFLHEPPARPTTSAPRFHRCHGRCRRRARRGRRRCHEAPPRRRLAGHLR